MSERAMAFHGPGRPLELTQVARPSLRDGEMLVRVLACNLCRSDLHSHAGRRSVPTPTILGHEIVGRIEEFGPRSPTADMAGEPLAVGDRVTWSIVVGCGRCYCCTHDLPQKCDRLFKYGHAAIDAERHLGGGLADFVVLLPGTAYLRVPNGVPDAIAALANCGGATAAAVLRYAGPIEGQCVLVIGAGVLGTLACAMASAAGARQVVAVDPHPVCRERARQFGATHTFDAAQSDLLQAVTDATGRVGADVVLELAGSANSVATSLSLVRVGGVVVLAGTVADCESIPLDPQRIVRRMITLRGVHNYHPRDLQTAMSFLAGASERFPVASLMDREYALQDAEEAIRRAHAAPGMRVTVRPG